MIQRGKYSAFEGSICSKEKHGAPSVSRYFLVSEFNLFFFVKEQLAISASWKVYQKS